MRIVFSELFKENKEEILQILNSFEDRGTLLGDGERNTIKVFNLSGKNINVKSFKVPNPINKVIYRYFRKSKAERSFNYANYLLSRGINTPTPIAFVEENYFFSFNRSYYISEHLKYNFTFRELLNNDHSDFPNREQIIRKFTQFTFKLHENEIEFLDHSPGNTLIQLNNAEPIFFLVDLNRMNFKSLSFEERMANFSRLTSKKKVIAIMANEYSKLYSKPEAEIFDKMWSFTKEFQKNFKRKHQLKRKIKFWKNYSKK